MTKANEIDYILQHLTSLLTRNADQILLEQLGVGYSQFKILRIIKEQPVKQRYIADVLGQTEASISRQIKILVGMGYVIRRLDPRNKRLRLISVTMKGQEITKACLEALNKYYNSMLINFNEKQQDMLLPLLHAFHDEICNMKHDVDSDYLNYIAQ